MRWRWLVLPAVALVYLLGAWLVHVRLGAVLGR